MLKFSIFILGCTFPSRAQNGAQHDGPRRPPWMEWVNQLAAQHLLKMTEELIKDMAYKLKHAEKVRDGHGVSISFELGSVAAGVQERFYRMLNIYRKFANMKDFKSETYPVDEVMNAYHIIQGDYNEIRHEKALYQDIVRKHESTSRHPRNHTRPRPGDARRRTGTWRPNRRVP